MPTTDETIAYFDTRAAELRRGNLVDKWAAVEPLFEGLAPGRVVECGAGTGLYTLPMLARGHQVTAVDLSQASLDELRATADGAGLAGGLDCVAGDFLEVVGDLEPADAITFIKVLHHMEDRPTIARALQRAWRNLRPGGRVLVFEPNGLSPVWPVLFRLRGKEKWEAERNTLLIRNRFLMDVLSRLPGASVRSGYRYLVPGTVSVRARPLDRLDERLVEVPWLRAISGNLWFVAEKADDRRNSHE